MMCVKITTCIRMIATTVYDVPYLFASEGVHGFFDFGKRPFAQCLAQQVVADALCVCERSQDFFWYSHYFLRQEIRRRCIHATSWCHDTGQAFVQPHCAVTMISYLIVSIVCFCSRQCVVGICSLPRQLTWLTTETLFWCLVYSSPEFEMLTSRQQMCNSLSVSILNCAVDVKLAYVCRADHEGNICTWNMLIITGIQTVCFLYVCTLISSQQATAIYGSSRHPLDGTLSQKTAPDSRCTDHDKMFNAVIYLFSSLCQRKRIRHVHVVTWCQLPKRFRTTTTAYVHVQGRLMLIIQ